LHLALRVTDHARRDFGGEGLLVGGEHHARYHLQVVALVPAVEGLQVGLVRLRWGWFEAKGDIEGLNRSP